MAYFMAHAPRGFWPIQNNGELAVLYCISLLYIASRGVVAWGLDKEAKDPISARPAKKTIPEQLQAFGDARWSCYRRAHSRQRRPGCATIIPGMRAGRATQSSALHGRLFPEHFIQALLIFNGLRSNHCQRAFLGYYYPHFLTTRTWTPRTKGPVMRIALSRWALLGGLLLGGCAVRVVSHRSRTSRWSMATMGSVSRRQ